jgi:hypothetical protein
VLPRSFILTQASLCNLLRHIGFTSIYEVLNPFEYHNPKWPLAPEDNQFGVLKDRITLVAIKGRKQTLISSPATDGSPEIDRPERPFMIGSRSSPGVAELVARRSLRSRLGKILPRPLKQFLRKIVR